MTFSVVEATRQRVAPEASFYSAAIASVRLVDEPVLLLQVGMAYKKAERRRLTSPQREMSLDMPSPEIVPKLRVVHVIPGGGPSEVGLGIFRNMRVPESSVLVRAFDSDEDVDFVAHEDQAWWDTSSDGFLPDLPIRVEASRRGDFVYGLVSPI